MKILSLLLIGLGCIGPNSSCEAGGFFRRIPEVGEWARYDLAMLVLVTSKDENFPAGESPEATGALTLKCVGEETIDEVRHLWLESRLDVIDSDGTEHWMILKLLIPAEHVTDDDLAPHIVRGWTQRDDLQEVSALDFASISLQEDPSAFGMLLSFPVSAEAVGREQNKTLTIDGEEVSLTHNETGPLAERDLEEGRLSGEATWWPSDDHAFGIAAAEQLWNLDMQEPIAILLEYGIQMDLAETGADAVSDLPDHN